MQTGASQGSRILRDKSCDAPFYTKKTACLWNKQELKGSISPSQAVLVIPSHVSVSADFQLSYPLLWKAVITGIAVSITRAKDELT